MKSSLPTLLFCLLILVCAAQRPNPDVMETAKGKLTIQPIFHGSIVFTWEGKTIYVDPYNGAKGYAGLAAPDLVLITDIHGDHLDLETLKALDLSKATLIVPQAVSDKLPDEYQLKAKILANGKSEDWQGIRISATPMYNLPEQPDAMHTKGRGNGYLLNLGGKNIYISGDTEDIPEMRALKNIDVAFVCMNLPYTMDINQAASAATEFKPKIVYPFHYRGKEGLSDTQAFKELVTKKDPKIEVRLRNWYSEQ